MRDRKDTLVNKILLFRLKLANIAPKLSNKVLRFNGEKYKVLL